MPQVFQLEEFSDANSVGIFGAGFKADHALPGPEKPDITQMAAYEQGYQAGYEDAASAATQDQSRISAELSHNLQDLGFTFHEARSHVLNSVKPVLQAMIGKLLPDMVSRTLSQRVLEEIAPLVEAAADTPIQVMISPENRNSLEPLLTAVTTCPLELLEEPSLGLGQIYLRSGKTEKLIDTDAAFQSITDALSAIENENSGVFAHG